MSYYKAKTLQFLLKLRKIQLCQQGLHFWTVTESFQSKWSKIFKERKCYSVILYPVKLTNIKV